MSYIHALSGIAAVSVASAAHAVPVFDQFGPLSQATFGGMGIPNDEVAASIQIVDGDVTITVALSATQRFSNPALTNDGLGTYFATPGSNFGGMGESTNEGALWNFNYYIEVVGSNGATPVLTDYQIDLFYDFDTAFDNDNTPSTLGRIDVTAGLNFANPLATTEQGSQNLLFSFLDTPTPPFVFPPAGSFDPNALGEYNFAITVFRPGGGFPVETVAIDVRVIPAPSAIALLASSGLLALRRRR